MSGITGIFSRTGVPLEGGEGGAAQAMLDSIRHRGPDGLRLSGLGPAAFGQAMLWTTQESLAETLPCRAGSGDLLLLTADARIDNRDELLAEFGEEFDGDGAAVSDSALILQSYRKWGDSCAEHLLGDFAFAVYDARRGGVFCARDHFGVKPFYYSVTPEWLVFGSEQKALFASGLVADTVDSEKIDELLVRLSDDAASTLYAGVRRLPPASTLFVDRECLTIESYWALDPIREIRLPSNQAYAQEFSRLFRQAVSCRLRSAYPVGSFLSGGLDSSAITATASQLLTSKGEKLQTFSAVYSLYPQCDESRYINLVARQAGVDSHTADVSGRNPLADLQKLSACHDGPVLGAGMYKSAWLYDLARMNGVRIMLDGHDGDSTVSLGFGYLNELALTGRWPALWRETKQLAKAYPESASALFWNRVEAFVFHPARKNGWPASASRRIYLAAKRRLMPRRPVNSAARTLPTIWDLLRSESKQAGSPLRTRVKDASLREASHRTEREEHYSTLTQPLHAAALEELDKTIAIYQIEARYPFFDKRLVEFCLALPPEQKLNEGYTRIVMRRAMDQVLPQDVQWRRDKIDFTEALCEDIIDYGKDQLTEMLSADVPGLSDYIDVEAAREARDVFQKEAKRSLLHVLYPVITLSAWLRARQAKTTVPASLPAAEHTRA